MTDKDDEGEVLFSEFLASRKKQRIDETESFSNTFRNCSMDIKGGLVRISFNDEYDDNFRLRPGEKKQEQTSKRDLNVSLHSLVFSKHTSVMINRRTASHLH